MSTPTSSTAKISSKMQQLLRYVPDLPQCPPLGQELTRISVSPYSRPLHIMDQSETSRETKPASRWPRAEF